MSLRPLGIQPYRSPLDALYRLMDSCSILIGIIVTASWGGVQMPPQPALVGAVAIAVFFLVGELTGLYRSWRGARVESETLVTLGTWAVSFVVLLLIGFVLSYTGLYPRALIGAWFLLASLLMVTARITTRLVLRGLRARGLNSRKCAIVGVTDLGLQLARNIENAPELGLNVSGFYDDRPESRTSDLPEEIGRKIGNLDELVQQARDGEIDMIYITFPMRAEDRIRNVLERLSNSTSSVYVVPDFFVFELLHSRWTDVGGLPAVSVFENPLFGADGMLKRTVDLCLTSVALVLLALPMLLIAALIKIKMPGPVFFRQRRYGLDGREFLVWKFRSMKVSEDGDRVVQATQGDSRVTPLGRFLRKSSLDELPQLFNVLSGSMSLVGPRPHATAHNEEYRELIQGYMLRHKVKPGITGLAQVNGWRGETDTLLKMEKRIEFDHRYIREWSLWMDFTILVRTLFVVLSAKNAY